MDVNRPSEGRPFHLLQFSFEHSGACSFLFGFTEIPMYTSVTNIGSAVPIYIMF